MAKINVIRIKFCDGVDCLVRDNQDGRQKKDSLIQKKRQEFLLMDPEKFLDLVKNFHEKVFDEIRFEMEEEKYEHAKLVTA